MNRTYTLFAVLSFVAIAAPAAAQDDAHTLRIEQVDDATARVRGAGRVELCEGTCELTLATGDYTIESTRLRGHRPIPITVEGDGAVQVRTRTRRGLRIFGGIAAAIVSTVGLGMVGAGAATDCSDEFLCFRELTMRICGGVLAAGLTLGLTFTLIRDRTLRVETGPLS